MVVRAMKFTPEVLLSAPRRSAGVPNSSGTRVLYTTSTYDFKAHKKSTELRLLDVHSGDSHELAKDDDVSDFQWLDNDTFACLQSEKDGTTSLYVADVSKVPGDSIKHYVAGKIDAAAGNLKVAKLDKHGEEFAVVVSAQALPDGRLYSTKEGDKKTHSTGLLYSKLFVRHWDHYEGKQKNALWFGKLSKGDDGNLQLSTLSNALKGSGLECPMPPFGGGDHFDVGPKGIILVAKDPKLNPALNVKCNVYLLQIDSWTQSQTPPLEEIPIEGFEGAATSPVFNPQGTGGSFLMMKEPGYEADKNRIFIIEDINVQSAKPKAVCLSDRFAAQKDETFWSRSPGSIAFSIDSHSILATAEDEGTGKLYEIQLQPDAGKGQEVQALTTHGNVGDVKPLKDGRTFFSANTLLDNSFYGILSTESGTVKATTAWTHSNSADGSKFGLRSSQVSSIWTPANNPKVTKEVHSLVIKPSNFEEGKKYPVAYLIHGGPQGSWVDGWSTRWNPAVFAEQGYIVIAPNPTGSTGYGQDFTDAIRNNWGGDPYEDIVKVCEWVGENMPEADNDRAVSLGGSYGGYMMNWMQGHDLSRRFKALVNHDGVFSFAGGQLPTDELYFPFHDLGGTPWYDPGYQVAGREAKFNFGETSVSDWRRWDPVEHLDKWVTPMLVIHSEKDYRLPVSEGLAAFNVLQARGIDSQFLTFPDENHWVLNPENSLVWHKVVLNWINKYVGLPPYTEEDPDSDEFFGGVKEEKTEPAAMPIQGKSET